MNLMIFPHKSIENLKLCDRNDVTYDKWKLEVQCYHRHPQLCDKTKAVFPYNWIKIHKKSNGRLSVSCTSASEPECRHKSLEFFFDLFHSQNFAYELLSLWLKLPKKKSFISIISSISMNFKMRTFFSAGRSN